MLNAAMSTISARIAPKIHFSTAQRGEQGPVGVAQVLGEVRAGALAVQCGEHRGLDLVDGVHAARAHFDHLGLVGAGQALRVQDVDEGPALVVLADVAVEDAGHLESGHLGLQPGKPQVHAQEHHGHRVADPEPQVAGEFLADEDLAFLELLDGDGLAGCRRCWRCRGPRPGPPP